jgi:AcrR family transcriptional regulator
MARPPTQHAPTRARIVESARRHIAERGVANLELAPVAAEAGLTAPSLYHYVDNRRALVLAALREEIDDLLREVVTPDDRGADTRSRLRSFLDRQRRWLAATSPYTVGFVLESVLESSEATDVQQVVAPVFGHAERLFRDVATAQPGCPPEQSAADAAAARTMLAGIYLMRAVGADVDISALLDTIETMLISSSK